MSKIKNLKMQDSHLTKTNINKNNINMGLLESNLKLTSLDTYTQVQI